jgi:hypothetical protein
MLSWLIGEKARDWAFYRDVFEDYPNASVYVDENDVVKVTRVSDIGEYWGVGTVILEWGKRPKLTPKFVKMEHYVAIPTSIEEVYVALVRKGRMRGVASYEPDFGGGFAIYECERCEEKQMAHFEVFLAESSTPPDEVVKRHLRIAEG